MAIWISTVVLLIVLIGIVCNQLRYGRRSKDAQQQINQQIDDLAHSTFDRHRDLFGKDPTGVFPLIDTGGAKK